MLFYRHGSDKAGAKDLLKHLLRIVLKLEIKFFSDNDKLMKSSFE